MESPYTSFLQGEEYWPHIQSIAPDGTVVLFVSALVITFYHAIYIPFLLLRGAVAMNIFALVVIIVPSTPTVFKVGITIPVIALQNILACRVFRLLKLGLLQTSPDTLMTTTPTGGIRSTIRFHTSTAQTSINDYSLPETSPGQNIQEGDNMRGPSGPGEV